MDLQPSVEEHNGGSCWRLLVTGRTCVGVRRGERRRGRGENGLVVTRGEEERTSRKPRPRRSRGAGGGAALIPAHPCTSALGSQLLEQNRSAGRVSEQPAPVHNEIAQRQAPPLHPRPAHRHLLYVLLSAPPPFIP